MNTLIVGSGMAGRFASYLCEKRGVSCRVIYAIDPTVESVLNGGFYSGERGGLENWGGQIFLDYQHPIFQKFEKAFVLNLIMDFLCKSGCSFETYHSDFGFGILLPKNFCPSHRISTLKECAVNEINLKNKFVQTKDSKIKYDRLFLCTGSQAVFNVSGENIFLEKPKKTDLYDKKLRFINNSRDICEKVFIEETDKVFRHHYGLNAKIDYEYWNESLINLMHYFNGVIGLKDLGYKDFLCGFLIILNKVRKKKVYGFIQTEASKYPYDLSYRLDHLTELGNRGIALHQQVFQSIQFLRIAKKYGVAGDFHRGGALLKSGSIGYRMLNVLLEEKIV